MSPHGCEDVLIIVFHTRHISNQCPFGHKTQGFCFYYLPNIKSKWNKFKWKILDNSNFDNFHGGGDFTCACHYA
jgi:hypothetical protein